MRPGATRRTPVAEQRRAAGRARRGRPRRRTARGRRPGWCVIAERPRRSRRRPRLGRAAVGVDHVGGDRLVDRRALVEQRLDPAADVAEQQRPRGAEADPLHRVGEADPQEDHGVAGQQLAGGRVEDRAAAERQDAVVGGQRLGHRLALEVAEVRLAGLHEDVGDRAPLRGLDVGVGVAGGDAPGVGEQGRRRWSCRRPSARRGRLARASPEPQGVEVDSRRCAGSPPPSRRRTSPAPRRPAPARPSPRRRCRRPVRRRRRSAGGGRWPPRRWPRRRCAARGARSRSASSRRGPAAPRRWSSRPRCRRSGR